MATTTRGKAGTDTKSAVLQAVHTFIEGIDAGQRRYFVDTVAQYEAVSEVLRPLYDERNANHRKSQETKPEAERVDWPVSKFHAHCVATFGDAFGTDMPEALLR